MKKKIISLIFCMALAASLLTACGKKAEKTEATANPGVLRVGVVNGGDRFASNVAGAPVGIEADIARIVAGDNGYSVQFSLVDNTEALLTGMMNGEYDLGFGRLPKTDQRLTGLTVSSTYGKGGLFLVTPRYNYMDCLSVMQGGTLGISVQADPLKDEVQGIEAVAQQTYPALNQMGSDIASGSILAGLVSEREAVAMISDSVQAQELLNSPREEYVAVMPGGSPLKKTVDEAIDKYKLNKVNGGQETGGQETGIQEAGAPENGNPE